MRVQVKLEYDGVVYSFSPTFDYDDFSSAEFMFTDGNFGCDCNRSIFIGEHCDENFEPMECGDKIKLIDITEIKENDK